MFTKTVRVALTNMSIVDVTGWWYVQWSLVESTTIMWSMTSDEVDYWHGVGCCWMSEWSDIYRR
jgi:hypothetical protein